MKKICIALAALVAVCATLVGFSASQASAAGCGSEVELTRDVSSGSDNLLVPGRPIRFTLHVTKQDCDGYDQITGMWGTISKNSGGCSNAVAVTRAYYLNPNALGGYDAPNTQFICNGGQVNYITFWNANVRITSGMAESARCVAMSVKVDDALQGDPNYSTAALCFNGL